MTLILTFLGLTAVTYSIVARCPDTGQLGVAVQSHFFGTGAVVPWLAAGVAILVMLFTVSMRLAIRSIK